MLWDCLIGEMTYQIQAIMRNKCLGYLSRGTLLSWNSPEKSFLFSAKFNHPLLFLCTNVGSQQRSEHIPANTWAWRQGYIRSRGVYHHQTLRRSDIFYFYLLSFISSQWTHWFLRKRLPNIPIGVPWIRCEDLILSTKIPNFFRLKMCKCKSF